ncbi:MAG: hypothetical protein EAX96_12820 [Candidatus Lokiarchaeota archaeon]|nr:hypothetical protein [Candidatus Lokiarchaeota archaeon]
MVISEKVVVDKEKEEEIIKIKLNKKYLKLFTEICEENDIELEDALNSRLEDALVDSFNQYHSKCMRKRKNLGWLKGGKDLKRVPGFDTTQVEKILESKKTIPEKIEWLNQYRDGLVRTRQAVFAPGLPTVVTNPGNFSGSGVTPYMKIIPQAIEAINGIIRELEAEEIVNEKVTHKF